MARVLLNIWVLWFLFEFIVLVDARRRHKHSPTSLVRLPPFVVLSPRDEYAEGYEDYETGSAKKRAKRKPKKLARWIDMLDGSVDGVLRRTDTGANAKLFIVDSGCRGDVSVTLRPNDTVDPSVDETGHGTFVRAMLQTLVPDARVTCVKVFDKDGTCPTSRVAAAFDYVLRNCVDAPHKCVINFSGQSSQSGVITKAVERLIAAGIVLVVASGNYVYSDVSKVSDFQMDACNWSPSGLPGVVAVGATDDRGVVASWSKIGPCVSSFGPGDGVEVNGRYLYGTSFGVTSETARRVQCASVGTLGPLGPLSPCGKLEKIEGFAALAMRKFSSLVQTTTKNFALLM